MTAADYGEHVRIARGRATQLQPLSGQPAAGHLHHRHRDGSVDDELGDAQVFLVEAPAGVPRRSAWGCGVGVLYLTSRSRQPAGSAASRGRRRAQADRVASARPLENGLRSLGGGVRSWVRPRAFRWNPVEAGKDAVQAEHVAALHERVPPVKIGAVRLPVTLLRSRRRLRSMTGRHSSRLRLVRWLESWRWSARISVPSGLGQG